MRSTTSFAPLFTLLVAAGCSPDAPKPVPVHPVSGQVLYDGKPAVGVQVYFSPTTAPGVPEIPANPHGVTDAQGRFNLSTYGNGDGAAEGSYQVILLWPPEHKEGEEERDDEDRLLRWYDAVHSQLNAGVKAGNNNLPPFNLPARKEPPAAGSEGIPGRN